MTHPPDWSALAATIDRAERGGVTLGVAVSGPTGERFAHRADRRFVAASTVKIAVMVELFRRADAAALALDEPHVLRAQDRTTGSGVLHALHDGLAPTLADLAYLMMSISDNGATNILIDRLGMAPINATMRSLGMAGSALGRRMRGEAASASDAENWACPEDYVRAVAALLDGTAAAPASCARMLSLLEAQQNERRIARHLPRGADRPRWGSKTGSLPGVVNDVGFVHTPRGPVVLALFCEAQPDPHAGEALLGDLAREALDAVKQERKRVLF